MSRTRVRGTRPLTLWLLLIIAVALVAGVGVAGLYAVPTLRDRQSLDRHYRAGVAFQDLGQWDDAEVEFKAALRLDAGYLDVQERLAQVQARRGAASATPAPAPGATPTEEAPGSYVELGTGRGGETLRWSWLPGLSGESGYEVSPGGSLTLTAGPGTDFRHSESSAPRLEYPVAGDFVAQAKINYSSSRPEQAVGLGVREREPSGNWIALRQHVSQGMRLVSASQRQGNSFQNTISRSYQDSVIYLRVVRRDGRFTLAYSGDGTRWIELRTGYEFLLPDQVLVFVFVASPVTGNGAIAIVSELQVTQGP